MADYTIRIERRNASDRYPFVVRTADGIFVSRHSTRRMADGMLRILADARYDDAVRARVSGDR